MTTPHTTTTGAVWRGHIVDPSVPFGAPPFRIGVLEGEGVGPDLLRAAREVLAALASEVSAEFDVVVGEANGLDPATCYGSPLSSELAAFCRETFAAGGALLCGPAGGRFVYDLRETYDLFCKLVPVKPFPELRESARLRPEFVDDVDLLVIRENTAGMYFGRHHESMDPDQGRRIDYTFSYSEREVRRILAVAARVAAARRGHLTVVTKEAALPGISDLWRECAEEVGREVGIEPSIIHVDYAAYRLVQHATEMDVVVTSNLFGDILADVSALLLGSRSLSFSGNYAANGAAAYQTNHGSAHDLVGKDAASPVAQILSMAMMLRESFNLGREADHVERAVADVWREGWRTAELAVDGARNGATGGERIIGTTEMADRIAGATKRRAAAARS